MDGDEQWALTLRGHRPGAGAGKVRQHRPAADPGGEPGVPAGEAAAEVVVEDAGPDLQGDDPVHIRCVQGPGLASSAQRMGAAA